MARWRIRLGAAAELDFANILKWRLEAFGERQSRIYRETLIKTIEEVAEDPYLIDSHARDEILPGFRTLHVARRGRRGRHLLVYRVNRDDIIEVARILHDRMELLRHVPNQTDENT